MTSIAILEKELIDIVKGVDAFSGRGYSIFNADEIGDIAVSGVGYPLAAVAYISTIPQENSAVATGAASRTPGDVLMVDKQFAVLIAVEYNWSDLENTKPIATDLLDSVRGKLLGYKGVSGRPWRLADEGPINSSAEGVILYMQLWETTCIDKGDSA